MDVAEPVRALSDRDTPAPGRTRRNRGSEVVRSALINAAIGEFAAHGFEGASTRRIADAADAHQSQIKYHFDTKDVLWQRCVDVLITELDDAVRDRLDPTSTDPRAGFEATIRGLVHFAAKRPELNRIMMQEATSASDRLTWLVDTLLRDRFTSMTDSWSSLVDAGLAAPIDVDLIYHTIVGAASLIYANAPEAELFGIDPSAPSLVDRHADALVAMFLRPHPEQRSRTDHGAR
ncbi:MAG: TetR/AcrR family transcriptional regulator [Ilumatobacteraceae bacterium]